MMSSTTLTAMCTAAAFALTAGGAAAADVVGPLKRLDDTGMAACVVDGAFARACAGTGQDGEYGRDARGHSSGNGRAGFSFVRVCGSGEEEGSGTCPAHPAVGTGPDQWACTRDLVTGLLWEIKQADGSLRDQDMLISMQNWGWGFPTVTELRTLMNGAAVCGSTRWDAPTLTELLSLVDYARAGQTKIDLHYFPNTPTRHGYGVPYPRQAPDEGNYVGVNFITGTGDGGYPGDGSSVRLVTRPGQTAAARYADGVDPADVVDRWTRLEWQRCPLGMAWTPAACTGTPAPLTWPEALAAANDHPGWRLPNVKELASLTTLDDGLLDAGAFVGNRTGAFWSSTPFVGDAAQAWHVEFADGYAMSWYPLPAERRFIVLLVRDAAK